MEENKPTNDNCLYFDITKKERDSAVRYLLGSIIKSRDVSSFPSNYYTYDEDVNVYMAHLLFAVSLPEYHEMAEPYISMNSSDILQSVRATEDRTIRYFIFKVNADNLLIHSTVFNDLAQRSGSAILKKSSKHYRELAKLYYDQAAAYHKRIYRKKTGVGEVLQKLSDYYESYQNLLKDVREEYFDFMNSFRDQVFSQFYNELSQYEGEKKQKILMDQFLELYHNWLNKKDPQAAKDIERVVSELKQIDPQFKFDINKEVFGRGKGEDDDERKCA